MALGKLANLILGHKITCLSELGVTNYNQLRSFATWYGDILKVSCSVYCP